MWTKTFNGDGKEREKGMTGISEEVLPLRKGEFRRISRQLSSTNRRGASVRVPGGDVFIPQRAEYELEHELGEEYEELELEVRWRRSDAERKRATSFLSACSLPTLAAAMTFLVVRSLLSRYEWS